MKLILVRHGETDMNRAGIAQGTTGGSLNSVGKAQAIAVANALVSDLPFSLYTSPSERALETAKVVSATCRTPATELRELMEWSWGDLEGLTGDQMRQKYPEFIDEYVRDATSARPPAGETLKEVQSRAWPAVKSLVGRKAAGTAVMVTHGYTITAIVCKALGIPLAAKFHRELGSITKLELTREDSALVSLNPNPPKDGV